MQKMIWLLPILVLAACAEKNVASETEGRSVSENVANSQFFMTRPKPTEPVELVFDTKYNGKKPLNYRADNQLRMSGSASYQPQALREIAKPVKKKKNLLYIFDLRQESHGYINDQPVTWQADRDWANADLSHDEVIRRERRLLGDMKVGEKVNGTEIKSIETEESSVRSAGHNYVRITVTDHVRPTDVEVDRFVETVRHLPEDAWVHFHCRAGKGRTTTFMVMYDILKNAQKNSLAEINERVMKLSDDYDAMAIPAQTDWKYVYQKERAEFLANFYAYAKENPKIEKLWTEWTKK
ncbi:protein tyrosine phosphatase [Bdellovibrio bacteriovorus]|uniref:Protein tyrosine phosphatase n=1 Tax=Bdellovibrio bacteriovorus TaxID=959 RepID=A0A150WFC1_BDEBC|nr:tyrosine-protein phosphatase [Bdellovibrio bacteriovorus]KYG61643.1 protein tyrosine phosphatase [Bdellovibrio bacteriovorus]